MSRPANIVVVAAHPDDEVLGCGGTIARATAEGSAVTFAIVGQGATSRRDCDPAAVEVLRDHARAAAARLGVHDVRFFGQPDNRLDTVPLLDIIHRIEDLIAELSPEVVYTHHPGDLNIDHGVVHRAVLTATRPDAGCCVREVLAFEIPSSSEWAFGTGGAFRPSCFVDIAATLDDKLEAMACYESEIRDFPHPRSPTALRAAAQRWGATAGFAAAEPFEIIRTLR